MAVVPALTDFTFVEEKKGRLFVNTPNALEGNRVENAIQLPHSSRARRQDLLTASEQKRRSLDRSVHWSACFRRIMKIMTASRNAQMT